jgi:hypothetical protein
MRPPGLAADGNGPTSNIMGGDRVAAPSTEEHHA